MVGPDRHVRTATMRTYTTERAVFETNEIEQGYRVAVSLMGSDSEISIRWAFAIAEASTPGRT